MGRIAPRIRRLLVAAAAAFVFATPLCAAVTPTTLTVTATPPAGPTLSGISFNIQISPTSGTAKVTSGSGTWTIVNSAGRDQAGTNPFTLNATNQGSFSVSISGFPPDTYTVRVTYNGDASWGPSSGSGSGTVYADSKVTITSSKQPSDPGDLVTLTASVALQNSGLFSGTPTGTITWKDGTNTLGTTTLSGGSTTLTTSFLASGAHAITASYSGDSKFWTSSGTFTQNVRFPTITTVTASPQQVAAGGTVGYTISVTPASGTGLVTSGSGTWSIVDSQGRSLVATNSFQLNATNNGTFTVTASGLPPDIYTLRATYNGDATWMGGTDSASAYVGTPTTATLVSSLNPSTYGSAVSFTAAVTAAGGIPTGRVRFYDGTTLLGTATLSSGKATFSTASLSVGSHNITASYTADATYGLSTSNVLAQTVNMATPPVTLTSSAATAVNQQSVTFTATVAGSLAVPTGTISFFDNGALAATVTLVNGTATFTTSSLALGSHSMLARYNGDANYRPVNSNTLAQTINAADTTTTLTAPAVIISGGSATLSATVAADLPGGGTPTGSVDFFDGTTNLGSATLSSGSATLTATGLTAGSHSITARYAGTSGYNSSTSAASTLDVLVESVTVLTGSPNPANPGQSITLTATVTTSGAAPTGTVTFSDGGVSLGSAVAVDGTGTATMTTTSLASGTHTLTASYSGDTNIAPSESAPATLIVRTPSTTTLASSANPAPRGVNVTLTASVPSSATGDVTFYDGAAVLGTATVSSGTASLTLATLSTGSHPITAAYGGDSSYLSSISGIVSQIIDPAPTTTLITSSANPQMYGQPVAFTATLPADATGSVAFSDGGVALGTAPVIAGDATFTTSALTTGAHSIVATYSGDANYTGSASAPLLQTITVGSTATTLTSSANPSSLGESVTFTADVTDGATGTVTFQDGTSTIGTASLSGASATATFTTAALAIGSHSITASYAGDANYDASTSAALTQTVVPAITTTTLASSANPSVFGSAVTFTATITDGATGTVTFNDGATLLGAVPVSGNTASLTTSSLTAGSHAITAVYGGDSNFGASTSPLLTQIVEPSISTTSLTSSANPSTFGAPVTLTATVTGGGTGDVTFLEGATTLGTTPLSGTTAAFVTSSLASGSHTLVATYGGDANHAPSTSAPLTLTIAAAITSTTTTLASSPNPSTPSTVVTFTATVSPAGGGAVSFYDGATALGTAAVDASGHAVFTTTLPQIATHAITAVYSGNATHAPSTSASLTQNVVAAAANVASVPMLDPHVLLILLLTLAAIAVARIRT